MKRKVFAAIGFTSMLIASGAIAIDSGTNGIPNQCPDISPSDVGDPGSDQFSDVESANWPDSISRDPDREDICHDISTVSVGSSEIDNICYNTPNNPEQNPQYTWPDVVEGWLTRHLSFNFWPATTLGPHPLLVYFHPNSLTKHITQGNQIYDSIVLMALSRGWSVASVEFRHPVVDAYLQDTPPRGSQHPWTRISYSPALDTGYAIQFMRGNAAALKIDPNNIIAVGYSRGSLSLWQSLQPDLYSSTYPYSSKANAFYGYQAQTTYQCEEFANQYVTRNILYDPQGMLTDRQYSINQCETENPHWQQFGSAQASLTSSTNLPVQINYFNQFYPSQGNPDAGIQVNGLNSILNYNYYYYKDDPNSTPKDYNDTEHYPDMGVSFYSKYRTAVGPNAPVKVYDCKDNVTAGFHNLSDFVFANLH